MTIQNLQYDNCKLQYKDDINGPWKDINVASSCSPISLVQESGNELRCRIAAHLTTFVKEVMNIATQRVATDANSGGLVVALTTIVSGGMIIFTGGAATPLALVAAGVSVLSGGAGLYSSLKAQNAADRTAAFDDDFYDYLSCQLYAVLDFDAEVSPLAISEWTNKIRNYTFPTDPITGHHPYPNMYPIIADFVNSLDTSIWQAKAVEGGFIPVNFITCPSHAPYDLFLVGGGEADGGNAGEVIDHGYVNGIRQLTLKSGSLEGSFYRGTFELPYYTHCGQITIREVRNFNYPNVTGASNHFALYRPCGTSRTATREVLHTGEATLADLNGQCLVSIQLYSQVNVLDPQPFEIDIDIEPCCHDWREEGQQGWQEIGQTSPTNVVFDNIGLYGLIPTGQTVGVGAVYLQHNRDTSFKIHFEGKDLTTFTVAQSDTVPTSVPSTVINADTDGYYLVTKPYVILAWNVTGAPSAGNPGTGNPVFTKFCYEPAADERLTGTATAPWTTPPSGENGPCLTATNLMSLFQTLIGNIKTSIDASATQSATEAIISAQVSDVLPIAGTMSTEITQMAAQLHILGSAGITTTFTTSAYDDFKCAIYAHTSFNFNNFSLQ